ncbi:MAG: hypothetical protein K9K66_04415 [Desulfarculaceae bacterium]|nr:hypothetical protein [Desulfarculaceae bacterium]MCF8073287.1 hypothetical protein [Desulfarculaceae bacterium]MCF8100883.1 hypothetical protein [Desulfarculaceae bacterium]MCF8116661.1 hypothetical protein [Desulfarculaceae bacterium]
MPAARQIDGKSEVKLYEQHRGHLNLDRSAYNAHGKEVSEYILPGWGDFSEDGEKRQEGEKKHAVIYDGEPARAIEIGAAGLRAGITPPAQKWLKLTMPDPDLSAWGPVRRFLDDLTDRFLRTLPQGGFYNVMFANFMEDLGFGTYCSMGTRDPKRITLWTHITAGRYWISRNYQGDVDTLYRSMRMTARAMRDRFGEQELSQAVQNCFNSSGNPFDKHQVVHLVQPNQKFDPDKADNQSMPWESVHYEPINNDRVLRRSGFNSFPYQVGTYYLIGDEDYGRGPGQAVLPDVKTLFEYGKAGIKGTHKSIDPPVVADETFKGKLRLLPGGVSFGKTDKASGVRAIYDVTPDMVTLWNAIKDLRAQVAKRFFNDLFIFLLQNANATATEILKRDQEKALLLGPLVDRVKVDMLDPGAQRHLDNMMDAGAMPPIPPEVMRAGGVLEIEYTGELVRAQKMAGVSSMDQIVSTTLNAAQQVPEVADNIDLDVWVRKKGNVLDVPAELVRTPETVQQIRQSRAQEQQERMKQEQALAAVQAARELSRADTEGKNALTDLAGAMGNE